MGLIELLQLTLVFELALECLAGTAWALWEGLFLAAL